MITNDSNKVFSSVNCIRQGSISQEMDEFFADIYPVGPSTIIGGGIGSGKTAQISRIPLYLDPHSRILIVEDGDDMTFCTRKTYLQSKNIKEEFIEDEHAIAHQPYDMQQIVDETLSQKPDWIFIEEIKSSEMAAQALNANEIGSNVAFTIHANSGKSTAVRFNQLAGNSSFIDLIIYQKNVQGVRRVTEIAELMGFDTNDEPILNPIFEYNFKKGTHHRIGSLIKLRDKMIKKQVSEDIIKRWCTPIDEVEKKDV